MNPEFHDHRAKIRHVLFHLVDFLICPFPVRLTAEALDPLHHHAPVPGAVEDRNMPRFRHLPPETPQIMVYLLHIIRCRRRIDLVAAWIQVACQAPDRTAFSRRIPAFKADHHRNPQPVQLAVQHLQLFLQLIQTFLIFLACQRFRQIHAGKHAIFKPLIWKFDRRMHRPFLAFHSAAVQLILQPVCDGG